MTALHKMSRFGRRFGKSESGTVLIFMALALLPIMMIIGGFVDYGRALRAKVQLEATADAGILAAQQQYALDNEADYEKIISDYLAKNLNSGDKALDIRDVNVDSVEISEDGEMIAHISGKVAMTFLSLIGVSDMNVGVNTAARVGGSAFEVALVLDNTGSMSGSKIDALKAAAKDMVKQLMNSEDDDRVKFALVPFAQYVNIGTGNRGEDGLDIPADYTVVSGFSTLNYKWYGCMGSRPHDLNVRDDDYDTQGVPGLMTTVNTCSTIKPVTPLTNNRGTITSGIETMNAGGYTYIPGGLAWGWRVLSPEAPFTDGVAYDDDHVRKVIVLMTDGANTRTAKKVTSSATSRHDGSEIYYHEGTDTAAADAYTSELCTNIKSSGVMLFTISFDVAGDLSIQNLLRNCAGNGGQYFNADDSAALTEAFHQISLSLLNLRLSK